MSRVHIENTPGSHGKYVGAYVLSSQSQHTSRVLNPAGDLPDPDSILQEEKKQLTARTLRRKAGSGFNLTEKLDSDQTLKNKTDMDPTIEQTLITFRSF